MKTISHFQSRIQGPGIGFPHTRSVSLHIPSESKICLLLSSTPIIVQILTLFYFSYCHCILASRFPSLFSFTSTCTSQNEDRRILLKIRKVISLPRNLTVAKSLEHDFARPSSQAAKGALVLFLLDFSLTSCSCQLITYRSSNVPLTLLYQSYNISKQRRSPSLFSNTSHHFFNNLKKLEE